MKNTELHNQHTTHHEDHHEAHDVGATTQFGFLIYLMTDVLLFGTLIATFIVLSNNFIPPAFNLNDILLETILLLTSSFTIGLAILYAKANKISTAITFFIITWLLGAAFLYLEITEFIWLSSNGFGPSSHAYFSAFFALLGTHAIHIIFGLAWMAVLIIQLCIKGNNEFTLRKLAVISLFWHFLDIVWIFVFSIVYLMGAL